METDGEPAVGSPAWLELQHQKERAREGALTKPPTASAEVVLGAVLLLLGIVVNVVLAGGGEGGLYELTIWGVFVVRILPVVLGAALIVDGLRRRGA